VRQCVIVHADGAPPLERCRVEITRLARRIPPKSRCVEEVAEYDVRTRLRRRLLFQKVIGRISGRIFTSLSTLMGKRKSDYRRLLGAFSTTRFLNDCLSPDLAMTDAGSIAARLGICPFS
jgi:hypothetical protein